MERINIKTKDKDTRDDLEQIFSNAFGMPLILKDTPTASQMKANTMAKVKDATNYLYVKFADGKLLRIDATEIT